MGATNIRKKIQKIKENPWHVFYSLADRGLLTFLNDEVYLQLLYRAIFDGKKLDLNNPQTFNEKLQWLKLYDRKPEYTLMADKYEAKQYIADRIGDRYVIPTLGIWEAFDKIDFDALPKEFVLKCTHDSGGLVVCRDKSSLNIEAAREKINRSLNRKYYYTSREWPYKNIKPRIISEPLIHNSDYSMLEEYNFFCFSGEPKFFMHCYGDRDRGEKRYNDYFMVDGERLPLQWGNASDPNSVFTRFDVYEDMLDKASKLSSGVPFLRVDFYLVDGKAMMGELTFYSWGGMMPINPPEYDLMFGKMLQLPQKT